MGNMCGCVRDSKEECYVDPTKAPISASPKQLRGRRYFQRRKKRKSADFNPTDSLRSHGSCKTDDLDYATSDLVGTLNSGQDEFPRPRQHSISQGVYVGEVPVLRGKTGRKLGSYQINKDKSRRNADHTLHGVTKSSGSITAKDRLVDKKLLRRQLGRAASFGAVEHMLQTHGHMEGFSKMIWDTQVHRKRRRAHTCSGDLVSQASLDTVQQDLKLGSTKHQEVISASVNI